MVCDTFEDCSSNLVTQMFQILHDIPTLSITFFASLGLIIQFTVQFKPFNLREQYTSTSTYIQYAQSTLYPLCVCVCVCESD